MKKEDDPDVSVDFSDSYEDDDFRPPFQGNQAEVMAYLKRLEDDNLFKVNNLQEDEAALKQTNDAANYNFRKREEEIEKVEKSIADLNKKKTEAEARNRYLTQVLNRQEDLEKDNDSIIEGHEKEKQDDEHIGKRPIALTL